MMKADGIKRCCGEVSKKQECQTLEVKARTACGSPRWRFLALKQPRGFRYCFLILRAGRRGQSSLLLSILASSNCEGWAVLSSPGQMGKSVAKTVFTISSQVPSTTQPPFRSKWRELILHFVSARKREMRFGHAIVTWS